MNRILATAALAAAFGLPMVVGCDDKVAETSSKTTTPDGTTMKQSETVKEKSDGTMVTEKKATVDRPNAPDSKDVVKTETKDGEVKKMEVEHK